MSKSEHADAGDKGNTDMPKIKQTGEVSALDKWRMSKTQGAKGANEQSVKADAVHAEHDLSESPKILFTLRNGHTGPVEAFTVIPAEYLEKYQGQWVVTATYIPQGNPSRSFLTEVFEAVGIEGEQHILRRGKKADSEDTEDTEDTEDNG